MTERAPAGREMSSSSRAVWKWPLPLEVRFTLPMPRGAEVLTVQTQYPGARDEAGCIWALVDPSAPVEPRTFQLIGTGAREHCDQAVYVGTYQLTGGTLVMHVFEITGDDDV